MVAIQDSLSADIFNEEIILRSFTTEERDKFYLTLQGEVVDRMIIYNRTTNKVQLRINGFWIDIKT